MKYTNVNCSFCNSVFSIKNKYYNYNLKNGLKFFCSKECSDKSRVKSTQVKCHTCGKEIASIPSKLKRSKSGLSFCSHVCSAKYSNSTREISQESRERVRQSLKKYYSKNIIAKDIVSHGKKYRVVPISREKHSCIICGNLFIKKNKGHQCCSKKCGQIYQFGILPYTKEEMLNKIMETYKKTNYTPQRRECEMRLVNAAVRYFGTWNKAMVSCGIKPNGSRYQKIRIKSSDGHMCDSLSEKTVDEWMSTNNIRHSRSKKYPNSKMDCDFYLPDHDAWVEYFGLIGQVEEYDKGVEIKRQLAKEHELNLIEILPSDLYPENKLDAFMERINASSRRTMVRSVDPHSTNPGPIPGESTNSHNPRSSK